MTTYMRSEIRRIVEEILNGTRTSNRFWENSHEGIPSIGDKVLFYSCPPVPGMPDIPERIPDSHPLAVVVRVSSVQKVNYTLPGPAYIYNIYWDDYNDTFSRL